MNDFGVVLFYTTSSAIRGEKVVRKAGFECSLIPVPREFSSDCGVSLRFFWEDVQRVKDTLNQNKVETSGVYELPE